MRTRSKFVLGEVQSSEANNHLSNHDIACLQYFNVHPMSRLLPQILRSQSSCLISSYFSHLAVIGLLMI